jgi:hypothetical protein
MLFAVLRLDVNKKMVNFRKSRLFQSLVNFMHRNSATTRFKHPLKNCG